MKLDDNLCFMIFLALFITVCLTGCTGGEIVISSESVAVKDTGISRIEDISELDEVISRSKVQHESINSEKHELYAEYFDTKEVVDYLFFSIRYKSGECEVIGYVCVPEDYLEKNYPVLIYNRGGNGELGKVTPAAVMEFSGAGFIVFATQYRGNDNGTGVEDFGGEDVQDVISLIDIAQQLPFVNGQIYMLGISRGGLQTYCTLKQESLAGRNRIAAAVIINGATNLTELYDFRDWDMKMTLKRLIGGAPDELPEEYEKRSAVCWPELMDTPLLIVHGKDDMRAPAEQAETMYDMLQALEKDVELQLYNAGHMDLPPESYIDAFEWLRSYSVVQ